MKIVFVVLMFFSAHAFATNIWYQPIVDPGSKQPAMIYLTDDQDNTCNGKWFVGKVVSDKTGKRLMRNDLCWAFNNHRGIDTKIPSTGFFAYSDPSFLPVPGVVDERTAVLKYSIDLMHQEFKDQLRAYQQAKPHP